MNFISWIRKLLGCDKELMRELAISEKLIKQLELYQDDSEKPEWLIDGDVYKPKVCVETEVVELQPEEIYAIDSKMYSIDVFRNLPHDEKLIKIWDFVVTNIAYAFDDPENWQYASTTMERRTGDCEDGTILFLVLCKLSGIKANQVFNCCGNIKINDQEFGHSWPIAQMSDGKWYVFESTLDSLPPDRNPILFKGSSYQPIWGFANWKWHGITNGEQI